MGQADRIKLTKEKKEEMIAAIKAHFLKEREQELGHLACAMILDFIIEDLAPEFYNQGIMDSYKYISDRAEDMQSLLL
jgi:uncharacterized protein (DUF2164 family)